MHHHQHQWPPTKRAQEAMQHSRCAASTSSSSIPTTNSITGKPWLTASSSGRLCTWPCQRLAAWIGYRTLSSSTPTEPGPGCHQLQSVQPLSQAGVFTSGSPWLSNPHQQLIWQQAHPQLELPGTPAEQPAIGQTKLVEGSSHIHCHEPSTKGAPAPVHPWRAGLGDGTAERWLWTSIKPPRRRQPSGEAPRQHQRPDHRQPGTGDIGVIE